MKFKGLTSLTKSQYHSLTTKDTDSIYCINDSNMLYAPPYSAADAEKVLRISSDGKLEWARLPNK